MAPMSTILEMTENKKLQKCRGNSKGAKLMDKDIIALDRFNAENDEGYKVRLRDNIHCISSPIPPSFCSVTDKEAKAVVELREVKMGSQ